ncbi:hypothetical protein [Streptomyces aurantiogriseus]|uniref:Uncharacterized protein n=1 Tax=Streptomyces aurantiogriseus TaxID=66870 RepID=A0A918KY06_9ACTN|nr:hypothetical protein [Streptomyces aurantiogriseus]GGR44560.1 hypothetical protein GCM10010251_71920 [Streptomyces aurantiogriseus]
MLLSSTVQGLLELAAGMLAQEKLGALGLILLFVLGVGIRARHNGLAVGAAVVLVALMTQA